MNSPTLSTDKVTPHGIQCRQRDRIQAIRDRFYREWHRITAECEAEIERVKREGL